MYEDPNVDDDGITVEFKWAGDAVFSAEMRRKLVRRLEQMAYAFGAEVEIHDELMLEQPTAEEVFGPPLYTVTVKGDTAEADSFASAALALHTLAKENGE